MSTAYKLLDFKWWNIDSTLYLSDSQNNIYGFDDSSQVVGGVSGIIRYNFLNTTFSTPSRDYYWLIYFRQLPTSNNGPRSLGFRNDRGTVITAKTGNHFQITHNGTSYWVYKSASVTYVPSRDEWQITSDNVDSNPVFINEGTSKKNTVHDLGDKTGSTDQQIYLEGLTYLLNEPAQGQGTVTLSIKKPGQTLNFASRLLSKTIRQYISSNATIDMNTQPVVENYSIEGLLNTATAYDKYCTYGYHIDADSRLFCAVKVYGLFYASIRESAYINIYLYYKGTNTPSMKTISNTGEEFSESISYIATSDPNIFKLSKGGAFMVWTNQNGRSATMADIISNAPILEGNNLSDSERDALAINYLNGLS